jgi:hypothetical protein
MVNRLLRGLPVPAINRHRPFAAQGKQGCLCYWNPVATIAFPHDHFPVLTS